MAESNDAHEVELFAGQLRKLLTDTRYGGIQGDGRTRLITANYWDRSLKEIMRELVFHEDTPWFRDPNRPHNERELRAAFKKHAKALHRDHGIVVDLIGPNRVIIRTANR